MFTVAILTLDVNGRSAWNALPCVLLASSPTRELRHLDTAHLPAATLLQSTSARSSRRRLTSSDVIRRSRWNGGSLLSSTSSKRADRLGIRTSPQVARLELISEADTTAADHRLGDGWRTPPAPRGGVRALPRYADLWQTAQSSRGIPAHRGPILRGKQSRGAPEGLAHQTSSLRKVTLKTLLRTANG
jgi:hypothetical protein